MYFLIFIEEKVLFLEIGVKNEFISFKKFQICKKKKEKSLILLSMNKSKTM